MLVYPPASLYLHSDSSLASSLNKSKMEIFSSQALFCPCPLFPRLGEWYNHHLASSLIPLSPLKYHPPASLTSLLFKYTWTLSAYAHFHFHCLSSRHRTGRCNQCGLPTIITLKRRAQCGCLSQACLGDTVKDRKFKAKFCCSDEKLSVGYC